MNLQTKVGQKKFVLVKLTGYQKIYEYGKGPYGKGVFLGLGGGQEQVECENH